MNSILAFLILFSILLMGNLSYARKDAGDYWKSMMKDEPMPKPIRDGLFHGEYLPSDLPITKKWDRLMVKNFDVRPSAIIYQSNSKPLGENEMQNGELKEGLVKQIRRG